MGSSLTQYSASPGGLQAAPGEMIFLQDGNSFVSNLRCVFRGDARIYASSGITSVGIVSTQQKWAGSIICILIAALLVIRADSIGVGIAGLLTLFAILFWRSGRPKHYLSLHTAGVSYTPLWSLDRGYIGAIVVAVNNAIIARG